MSLAWAHTNCWDPVRHRWRSGRARPGPRALVDVGRALGTATRRQGVEPKVVCAAVLRLRPGDRPPLAYVVRHCTLDQRPMLSVLQWRRTPRVPGRPAAPDVHRRLPRRGRPARRLPAPVPAALPPGQGGGDTPGRGRSAARRTPRRGRAVRRHLEHRRDDRIVRYAHTGPWWSRHLTTIAAT